MLLAVSWAPTAQAQEVDVPQVEEEAPPPPEDPPAQEPAAAEPAAPPPVETAAPPAEPSPAPQDQDAGNENIVVTGSRIARSSLTSYGNIAVVDAEQIRDTGALTVDDLLRRLPSITLQGVSVNNNNGGLGFRTLDLRNLQSDRTLVLVNGRRYITQGTVFNTQFVDINDIPVTLIDRIEILFDGASAVYGSDAVAGVVNFVLKDEFEGLEIESQTGISSRGDGEQASVTVTGGTSSAKGNVVVTANYTGYASVDQIDRDWGRGAALVALGDDEALFGSSAVPETRVGGTFFRPDPTTGLSFQSFRSAGLDQRYSFSQEQFLFGSQDRFMIHGLGKYELYDSAAFTAEGFFETNFIHRTTRTQLAPQPLFGDVSVSTDLVPGDYAATLAPGVGSVSINRRMVDVGNRINELQSFSFRQLFGVRGEIAERVTYEVFGQYTRNRTYEQIFNSIDVNRAGETGTPGNPVTGNWFGSNALSGAAADYMRYTSTTFTSDEMINLGVIFGSELFAIPTTKKKVGISVGYEYRRQLGLNRPDSLVQRGDSAGNFATETSGDYDANEVYAELLVPIASDLPAIYDAGVDGAIRFSDFSSFGSETTFRVRGRYAPVKDLALRGTFSTAFRAPNVGELFGGVTESFEVLEDPCDGLGSEGFTSGTRFDNCLADNVPPGYDQAVVQGTQISTNIGGNTELESETSESFNLGAVVTTTFLPRVFGNLSATFDFYAYDVDNAIGQPPGQVALDRCYESQGLSSEFCDLITRGADGQIVDFQLINQNLGSLSTSGIDFAIDYAYNFGEVGLDALGAFAIGFQGNYLLHFENIPFDGAEPVDLEGTADSSEGIYPRFTGRFNAGWGTGPISLAAFITYIDGMDVLNTEEDDPFNELGAIAYLDASATFAMDSWTFTAGVNNVTDESPPFLLGGFANSAPEGYDFMGRYFFLRGRYTF